VSVIKTLLQLFFIVEYGVVRFLCAMHVFEAWASSTFLGYLCAKFCLFCGLHCWARRWRKTEYSITQSLIQWLVQLIWCVGTEALVLRN